MATTTPNNGWAVPTSTDYVKDGATAIETLGDAIDTSAGKTWLAWTAFTPTWTGVTVGNGVYNQSHYVLIGKTAHVAVDLSLGTTSAVAVTGGVTLTLPANLARKNTFNTGVSFCSFHDTGVNNYGGQPLISQLSAQNWLLRALSADATYAALAGISSTIPFTWGSTDRIVFAATFEVA